MQPRETGLALKVNKDKVGVTKRPEQTMRNSGSGSLMADPSAYWFKHGLKTARIYMPQRKHVHNHPDDKTTGKYWVVDFGSTSTYKSPLMFWGTATDDGAFNTAGDITQMKFPSVNAAVTWCTAHGWGWDIQYPNFKYHTEKNYANNFKYKGPAKQEPEYD